MSELINNLNTIYNVKLQIKEAIGTESDDFTQYPSYISNLLPSGTSYITNNGDYNISSYEYVNVNVSGGGSTGTVIWDESDLFDSNDDYIGPENGDDVDVRGVVINNEGYEITSELVNTLKNVYPSVESLLTDNIGSYLLPTNISEDAPYFIYSTQVNPDSTVYSVKGTWGDYGTGNPGSKYLFIVSDVSALEIIPKGGSGVLTVSENETFDVSTYTSVNVSVPASAVVSGTYNITNNGTYDVTNYASAYVNVSGGGSSSTNTFSGYCFPYFDSSNNIYVWHILDDISGESGSEEFNTSNVIVATSSEYITGTSEHDLTAIAWGQYVTITADKYYGFSHISTVDNNYATIDTTVYPDNITNYYPLQTQTGDSVSSIGNNNFAGEVKLFTATLEGETLNCANKIKVGTGSVYKMYSIDSSSSIAKNDVVTATYVPVKLPGTTIMYPGYTIEVAS